MMLCNQAQKDIIIANGTQSTPNNQTRNLYDVIRGFQLWRGQCLNGNARSQNAVSLKLKIFEKIFHSYDLRYLAISFETRLF